MYTFSASLSDLYFHVFVCLLLGCTGCPLSGTATAAAAAAAAAAAGAAAAEGFWKPLRYRASVSSSS